MYIENNPLKFVRIGEFSDENIEEMKKRNIKGAYFGEYFILTTSEESYKQVWDMIIEFINDSMECAENISILSIKNIEEYVTCEYQEEYDILGVTGWMDDECENVMETIVFAFNEGRLSEEDLCDWENLIDKTVKQHVMENVAYELENKIKKLKEQKFNFNVLKELLQ